MNFPQYSNIEPQIQTSIREKVSNRNKLNSLMPWIRITSAVRNGLIISSNYKGDNFVSRYGDGNVSGGIGRDFDGKVVYAEYEKRQYRPSPIIENLDVKNGAQGLSRKASFTVKCFTLRQAERVAESFLEPRFFVLIEFGWNSNKAYGQMAQLSNSAKRDDKNLPPVCEMIEYQNLKTLKEKRRDSNGDYDCFLGVVTGGGLQYGDDESYLVNVEVTTAGEIPSYLQAHRGKITHSNKEGSAESSNVFGKEKIEEQTGENGEKIGRSLFMQMYNSLPSAKQIPEIKKLEEDPYWSHQKNFINMDDENRKSLASTMEGREDVEINGEKQDLPDKFKFFSEERFIRMELAWKILNLTPNTTEESSTGCPKKGGGTHSKISNKINIDSTILRAHKYIFSVDKSKLYIPNKNLPDFGLGSMLKEAEKGDAEQASQVWVDTENPDTINGTIEGVEFPASIPLNEPDGQIGDNTCYPRVANSHEWGLLKDLYINFDFFCECLKKNGFYIYDVALDILNGISSAVNLFWNFQIVERGQGAPLWVSSAAADNSTPLTPNQEGARNQTQTGEVFSSNSNSSNLLFTQQIESRSTASNPVNVPYDAGKLEMQVVDWFFTGLPPKVDNNVAPFFVFLTRGTKSPFLSFDLKLEVAGALANQVMMQRISRQTQSGASNEQAIQDYSIFTYEKDPVSELLNSIQFPVDEKEEKKQDENNKGRVYSKDELEGATSVNSFRSSDGQINTGGGMRLKDGTYLTRKEYNDARKAVKSRQEALYAHFETKAGIFPKNLTRAEVKKLEPGFFWTKDINLEEYFWIGTWDDSELLKAIETCEIYKGDGGSNNRMQSLLPVEINATIHGVSGLKVGDICGFDDLPRRYRLNYFQVFEVNQQVTDSGWITQAVFKMRNARRPDLKTPSVDVGNLSIGNSDTWGTDGSEGSLTNITSYE